MRRLVGLLLAGTLLAATPMAWAGARKLADIRVSRGYIDSHFAVSRDGTKVAYLHVLSDGDARLVVKTVKNGRILKKIALARYTVMPATLDWTSDGRFVILSWAAGKLRNWALVDWRAGTVKVFPKVRDFRCRPRKLRCVSYVRMQRGANTLHTVTELAYPSLRRKSVYRMVTDDRGRLAKPVMEVLYFRDDYLKAVGKIRGRYDKARDIRLPDREAVYDLTTKRIVSEKPIKDAIGWEKMRRFRKAHPALDPVFVIDDKDGKPQLLIVTTGNERRVIPIGEPMERFRPDSLVQKFVGAIAFLSLIVDPQNPLALKRRRSDKEEFYLFRVDKNRARVVMQLPSEGRYQAWSVGGAVVGIMALHKNWGLGGAVLSLYSL